MYCRSAALSPGIFCCSWCSCGFLLRGCLLCRKAGGGVVVLVIFLPKLPVMAHGQEKGQNQRDDHSCRLTPHNTVKAEQPVHDIQGRDEDETLAQHGDEDGVAGLFRGLQECGAELVNAGQRSGQRADADHIDAQGNDLGIIEKGCDQLMAEDTADNGQKQAEHQSKAGSFSDGLIHAVPLFRAVAVGDDGLHTEGDAHLQHTDDHGGLSCNGKGGDILIPMANQQIVLKDAADAV